VKKYICPKAGCGLDCQYDAPVCEEALTKAGKPVTRKPIAVQRVLWVICPVHGRVMYLLIGHHVSMNSGKRSKRLRKKYNSPKPSNDAQK
jgi:hypothetical protein